MGKTTDVSAAVRRGHALLSEHGYAYRTTSRDLLRWLHADTPYPNPTIPEILANPYTVVHEIVEIAEVRRMHVRFTKDVIAKHMKHVQAAHLIAAEVEMDIAFRENDLNYLRKRLEHIRGWCEDPLLAPDLRSTYRAFRRRIEGRFRTMASHTRSPETGAG